MITRAHVVRAEVLFILFCRLRLRLRRVAAAANGAIRPPAIRAGDALRRQLGSPGPSAAVLAVVVGTLLAVEARAVTDTAFRYSQPRTGSVILGPADFAPHDDTVPYTRSAGLALGTPSGDTVCFYGTARLPHLATITEVTLFYGRPAASDVIYLHMRRVGAYGTGGEDITGYPPSAPPVAPKGNAAYAANAAVNVVNANKFRYDLVACLENNAELYSVRVEYTYTHAGD